MQHYFALMDTGRIVELGLHDEWHGASDAADSLGSAVWIMDRHSARVMRDDLIEMAL